MTDAFLQTNFPMATATAKYLSVKQNQKEKENGGSDSWLLDVISTLGIGKNSAEVQTRLSDNPMLGEKKQYAQAAKIYTDNYKRYIEL